MFKKSLGQVWGIRHQADYLADEGDGNVIGEDEQTNGV